MLLQQLEDTLNGVCTRAVLVNARRQLDTVAWSASESSGCMAERSDNQRPERYGMTGSAALRGEAPGLKGVTGRLQLQVGDVAAGVLQIEPSGAVELVGVGDAAAVITVDTQSTLAALLSGESSPIVALLQDRLQVEGDLALAWRVLLGLQAGSLWKDVPLRT